MTECLHCVFHCKWVPRMKILSGRLIQTVRPRRLARRGCLALWGVYQSQKKMLQTGRCRVTVVFVSDPGT